jgi:glycosyltransferase involved in cell wall biosynthesis
MRSHPPRTIGGPASGARDRRHGRAPDLDVVVVGTYPPTRCGLATYTASTRRGLLAADPERRVDVVRLGALQDDGAGIEHDAPEIVAVWPRGGNPVDAAAACAAYDVVLVQHEFGIFDGREGDSVLTFADALTTPLVSVLHTVLVDPSDVQRHVLEQLAARSSRLIVLSQSAAARLRDRYRVDRSLVRVVPHGAEPNLGPVASPAGRLPTVLTWGLIGPGKGIEHGVRAVAELARRGLRVRYAVVGQTHPNVLAAEGERYRDELARLAAELGIGDLVVLDDGYRDWDQLHATVRGADVVLLPYDSREQVTSGVLVEALASAKPVVATAFPHAVEVVEGRAGIVVPHEEPMAIADALERLLTKPELLRRFTAGALRMGRQFAWPVVGAQTDDVLHEAVGRDHSPSPVDATSQ